jgi:hypothetical protein
MNIQEILAIAGKPGLFKVIASGTVSIVVESLMDGKRSSVPGAARVSNLSDITMYTVNDDLPLKDVLNRLAEAQQGKEGPSHKDNPQTIRDFIDGIVPELDHERVYQSDLKKLVQWYNMLTQHNAFPLTSPEASDEEPAEDASGKGSDETKSKANKSTKSTKSTSGTKAAGTKSQAAAGGKSAKSGSAKPAAAKKPATKANSKKGS